MRAQTKLVALDEPDLSHLSESLARLQTANSRYFLTMIVDIMVEGLASIEKQSQNRLNQGAACSGQNNTMQP
jgi:hypothetical protein